MLFAGDTHKTKQHKNGKRIGLQAILYKKKAYVVNTNIRQNGI